MTRGSVLQTIIDRRIDRRGLGWLLVRVDPAGECSTATASNTGPSSTCRGPTSTCRKCASRLRLSLRLARARSDRQRKDVAHAAALPLCSASSRAASSSRILATWLGVVRRTSASCSISRKASGSIRVAIGCRALRSIIAFTSVVRSESDARVEDNALNVWTRCGRPNCGADQPQGRVEIR